MAYNGAFGLIVSLTFYIGKYLLADSSTDTEDEGIVQFSLTGSESALLALGIFMDAASIFCQTIAYLLPHQGR